MTRRTDGGVTEAAAARTALTQAAGFARAVREDFRATLVQGRWLLVAAQTIVSAALMAERPLGPHALATLAVLFAYNVLSLAAIRRIPLRPWVLLSALATDLFLTGAAAWQTGGVGSPFLGQYFLIIFAGAVLYELRGGVVVGLAASAAAFLLAALSPPSQPRAEAFRALSNLVPYYLLSGGFAGILVRRVRDLLQQDYDRRLREEASEHEMELARGMQQAALPVAPPDVPGMDCAVVNRYAGEVGGDFLIFLPPAGGTPAGGAHAARPRPPGFGVVIGDVSGKGIPAALASTSIAHLLPWLCPLDDARRALQQLNDDLQERLPEASYATLIFAEFPAARDSVRLWTAGHPPAIHYRAARGSAAEVETSELPLGMFRDWDETPVILPWEPGDVLLLYTDGLNETRHAVTGEQFTTARIAALVAEHGRESAADIVDALRRAVLAWGTPTDDLTVVACRRL